MGNRWGEFSLETKEVARLRANYSCEVCGKKGRTECHHKLPLSVAKQLYEEFPISLVVISGLENCMVLCEHCHRVEHQIRDREYYIVLAQALLGLQARLM